MSPRTDTAKLTDSRMWRKLLRLAHPDAGGSNELFVWTRELQEKVCSGEIGGESPRSNSTGRASYESPRRGRRSADEPDRVPFDVSVTFNELTHRALWIAEVQEALYARPLRLLWDCYESVSFERQQQRGASYKMLAAIAHACGMSKSERVQWYRLCESIPLSDRHAGHILSRLKKGA